MKIKIVGSNAEFLKCLLSGKYDAIQYKPESSKKLKTLKIVLNYS